MKRLLLIHRLLSGISLLMLTIVMSGAGIPEPLLYGVLLPTLVFYLAELLIMTTVAIINIRRLDAIFPIVMLFVTVLSVKSLLSHNVSPSLIPVIIMFITGYMAGGEGYESGRLHKGEQS